jgi:hypothetical protein
VSDLLSMERINSLPHPLLICLCGDKVEWPLELVCVETGLLKFDVCGLSQNGHFGEVMEVIDANGLRHDAETFYSDYEVIDESGTHP